MSTTNTFSIKSQPPERRKFIHSLVFPFIFVLLIWLVKMVEIAVDTSFSSYGVFPGDISGLKGILFSPLIHGDFNHLLANTIPLLTLATGLFYFYKRVAFKVFGLIYILSGIWLWFFGRESFHIGASGLVYGLAFFIFFSGVLRKDRRLLAISLIVVFLYGSLIWGIFPTDGKVSWEGHLLGGISGLILAYFYKKEAGKSTEDTLKKQDYYPTEDYFPENQSTQTSSYSGVHIKYIITNDGDKNESLN